MAFSQRCSAVGFPDHATASRQRRAFWRFPPGRARQDKTGFWIENHLHKPLTSYFLLLTSYFLLLTSYSHLPSPIFHLQKIVKADYFCT
jgi:hypothetical protein